MPRLLLLRHAKSSWDDASLDDFSRPLNKRGVKDCKKIGSYIARKGLYPQIVLCSTAQRARETYAGILPFLPEAQEVYFTKKLYEAEAQDIFALIKQLGQTSETLLIVGHNPAIEVLSSVLARKGQQSALEELSHKYPTAALAIIDFDVANWEAIVPGTGWLAAFITPKALI